MKRRSIMAGAGRILAVVVVALLLSAATAVACVAPELQATPGEVQAGAEVRVTGNSFDGDLPVVVRFDALDGPVLGEFSLDGDEALQGTITIPEDTTPGDHVLVATQPTSDGLGMIPSRALVTVVGEGGPPLSDSLPGDLSATRPAGLVGTDQADAGSLALVALGAAAITVLLAWATTVMARSRRRTPEEAAP